MFNKKSIVLNGVDNSSRKAVLTLEEDGDILDGKVRLYNFGQEPKGILSLGLYFDGKVVKAGLTHSSPTVYTFFCQISQLPQTFSCAIINVTNGEANPILYGSSCNSPSQDEIYDEVISSLSNANTMKQVENILDDYDIDYNDDEKLEIEKEINECFKNDNCDKCDQCKYKEYYFKNVANIASSTENEESLFEEEKSKKDNFYLEIKSQIDGLFENNPNEEYLEQLIPNSKWVKVDIDNGDYYVLGLIYELDNIKYICYGVPGVYQKYPPKELAGFPIWFPLDENKNEGFGYWLSYQDAQSGESVKAVII